MCYKYNLCKFREDDTAVSHQIMQMTKDSLLKGLADDDLQCRLVYIIGVKIYLWHFYDIVPDVHGHIEHVHNYYRGSKVRKNPYFNVESQHLNGGL